MRRCSSALVGVHQTIKQSNNQTHNIIINIDQHHINVINHPNGAWCPGFIQSSSQQKIPSTITSTSSTSGALEKRSRECFRSDDQFSTRASSVRLPTIRYYCLLPPSFTSPQFYFRCWDFMPLPGWFTHSASFCVGATAAAAGVLIQSSQTSRTKKSDDASSSRNLMEDDGDQKEHTLADFSSSKSMQMLPTIPIRVFQPNDNLAIAFDTRNKHPLFVMERSAGHSSTPEKASRKNKSFHKESSSLPYHRSRNSKYRHLGYDRGHLAPAADFPLNDQEMNDTFVLTNISPQLPRFNMAKIGRIWEKSGRERREWTK